MYDCSNFKKTVFFFFFIFFFVVLVSQRDRMGRLVVFVSRVFNLTRDETSHGIGVSEHTALVVSTRNCVGTAMGVGPIDAITYNSRVRAPNFDDRLYAGPLNATHIDIGADFDLKKFHLMQPSTGHTFELAVNDGDLISRNNNGQLY